MSSARRFSLWLLGAALQLLALLMLSPRAQRIAVACVATLVTWLAADPVIAGAALVAIIGDTAVASDRQADLDKILDEAKALQDKYDEVDDKGKKKRWDKKDREKFEALCKEGEAIQEEIANDQKWQRLQDRGRELREVPEPSLPNARSQLGKDAKSDRAIAGYVTLGDFVIASEAFQEFAKENYATGRHAIVSLNAAVIGKNVTRGPRGEPLVPLTRDMRKKYEDFLQTKDAKAVPVLGTGVLDAERVARVPQVTADERLTIRDVISTGQTNANSIEYVREESMTNAAAETAPGAAKPEEALEYTRQQANVRDIAGWMPVQNQQIQDWPQLQGLIDGRLRYSVHRREENQVLWGDGTGVNLQGILVVAGTTDIAANGRYNGTLHTLIDVVRLGITDVLVAGYQPNAVVVHPYDWEAILLEKGTDERYVWAVVTDQNVSRIWGLRVVESIGAQERSGATTPERQLVVGDWQMGAQLIDRMETTVQVGLVNDQFIKNMRTLLAEERVALPIYAPAAFAHFRTQAEVL